MFDLSLQSLRLMRTFVIDPLTLQYCYAIARRCEMDKQVARVMLKRLAHEGWLEGAGVQTSTVCKRPERQLYRVTDVGVREATALLNKLQLPSSLIYVSSLAAA